MTVIKGKLHKERDGDLTTNHDGIVLGTVEDGKPRIRDQWYSASQLELDSKSGCVIARRGVAVVHIAPTGRAGAGGHIHPASGPAGTLLRLTDTSVMLRVDNEDKEAEAPLPMVARVHGDEPWHDPGTRLRVLRENVLIDVTVDAHLGGNRHRLRVVPGGEVYELDLNICNHSASPPLSTAEYEEARAAHCQKLAAETEWVEDAITLKQLKVGEQLISIQTVSSHGVQREEWQQLSGLKDLVPTFLSASVRRLHGELEDGVPVLVRAGPGTGKTWAAQQLTHELAMKLMTSDYTAAVGRVPVLLYVQRLARFVRRHRGTAPEHFLRLYLEEQYADDLRRREMLLAAYDLRALIVVLDGVDEASGLKDQVEAFVLDTLAHDRVGLVVTSRPEGVTLERYTNRFAVLDLKALSDEQQAAAVQAQLGDSEFFHHLMAFSKIRREHDRIYREVAFPSESERAAIESFAAPNRLLLSEGGPRDSEQRQRTREGSRFCSVSQKAPRSQLLCSLGSFFTPELLAALDDGLWPLTRSGSVARKEDIQAVVEQLPDAGVTKLVAAHGPGLFERAQDAAVKEQLKAEPVFAHMELAVKVCYRCVRTERLRGTI